MVAEIERLANPGFFHELIAALAGMQECIVHQHSDRPLPVLDYLRLLLGSVWLTGMLFEGEEYGATSALKRSGRGTLSGRGYRRGGRSPR